MKKTWIKIKRGLLTPEHREKLGVRVWLYLYMIDRADWDAGAIYGWKDKDEADDFGMSWRTLQQQRQQLEADGYITCEQKPYYQNIIIHNWTNPREYTGEQYNPIYGSTENHVPTDGGTESCVPLEGTSQGTYQSIRKPSTPTYDSHITGQEGGQPLDIVRIISEATGMVAIPPTEQERNEQIRLLVGAYGEELVIKELGDAFKLWLGQKRKDGRGTYKRTNFGWVDWAQEKLSGGEIVFGNNNRENTIVEELQRRGYVHHKAA